MALRYASVLTLWASRASQSSVRVPQMIRSGGARVVILARFGRLLDTPKPRGPSASIEVSPGIKSSVSHLK